MGEFSPTGVVSFFVLPRGVVFPPRGGWFVTLFLAAPALSEDDVLLFQALDGLQERLLAQAHPPIQDTSTPRPQTIVHLRKTDVSTKTTRRISLVTHGEPRGPVPGHCWQCLAGQRWEG